MSLISEEELKYLKMNNEFDLSKSYNNSSNILIGKDKELNTYHLEMESLVNRFEKSMWDIFRILIPMTCESCVDEYYIKPMKKGYFITINKLNKMTKEKVIERTNSTDRFGNQLTDKQSSDILKYLNEIEPFFKVRNSLVHRITDYINNVPQIHPMHSTIISELDSKIQKSRNSNLWKYETVKGFSLWQLYKQLINPILHSFEGLNEEYYDKWSELAIL